MSGKPLPQRFRLGPVELDRYLAGQLSGLAYMRRLRAIEDEEARHLRNLEEAWRALAEESDDDAEFALAWREVAAGWSFRHVNDLIASHNAYYPIEARVPMNPRTGSYARSWQRRRVHGRVDPRALPAVAQTSARTSGSELIVGSQPRASCHIGSLRPGGSTHTACMPTRSAPASSSLAPSPTNTHSSGSTPSRSHASS